MRAATFTSSTGLPWSTPPASVIRPCSIMFLTFSILDILNICNILLQNFPELGMESNRRPLLKAPYCAAAFQPELGERPMTKESVTVKSDFSKLFMQFPVGGLRFEDFIASQQKNYDAFTKATQLATESWSLVITRQAELARKAAEDSSNTVRQLFNGAA